MHPCDLTVMKVSFYLYGFAGKYYCKVYNGIELGHPAFARLSGMARVKKRVKVCPPLAGVGGGVERLKNHSMVCNTGLLIVWNASIERMVNANGRFIPPP